MSAFQKFGWGIIAKFDTEKYKNMGATKRKTIITIETRQRTVVRQDSPQSSLIWCELCAVEVEMITPKSAARLSGVSEREIFRRIEQGGLHFVETADGEIQICKHSALFKI